MPDVLDSDIRDFLKELCGFVDQSRLYSLTKDLFCSVMVGGNLALNGDEQCVVAWCLPFCQPLAAWDGG